MIRNARKLRSTGIYINEDLCPASQEIVKSQLPRMKQARSEGKTAYFKHTRHVFKERMSGSSPTGVGVPPGAGVSRQAPLLQVELDHRG